MEKTSSKPVRVARKRSATRLATIPSPATKPARKATKLSPEAEETLNAIRAGQVDALVIRRDKTDQLYALRSFVEIERTQEKLKTVGAARRRSQAQLKALAEERERLMQDMHDGCIQSIYGARLHLEACMRLMETDPKKASIMVAEATVALNLVIQEMRSFINGHTLAVPTGDDLRLQVTRAADAAAHHGLSFSIEIAPEATRQLSSEQSYQMLQITREAISNAVRHANARSGIVSLRKLRGGVQLEVRDDGSGFIAGGANKLGLGLRHIAARARKLGGVAKITSAPNRGTRIVVTVGKA
ncbi:MAG: ATP-binding protein [Betaproteobacteria bacterium]